jgi:hypothetical protein
VPPYRECATLGHFERLEYAVSNQQAVISSGDGSLLWVVVNAAAQPNPELLGQGWCGRRGEMHPVRLPATSDHGSEFGVHVLWLGARRLDSSLSLGYGF